MGKLDKKLNEAVAKEGSRSFLETLRVLNDGQATIDLTKVSHELQQELYKRAAAKGQEGEAKGVMTVKYRYHLDARGTCVITQEYPEAKAEKPDRGGTHFWLTEAKNVSKEPPRQIGLPLAAVADANEETDEADEDDGEIAEA